MKEQTVFDFNSHSTVLQWALGRSHFRGAKAKLAEAIGCQASFLSLVLAKKALLNLEQTEAACRYFAFTADESEHLLLLLQKERAGTKDLKKYFEQKLESLRAKRLMVVERLGRINELAPEKQATYYSSWIFAAVHIALTIPALQTPKDISVYLGLNLNQVLKSLEFLESIGLCVKEGERYLTTKNMIRLSKESNNLVKHHTNWRLRAIASLDDEQDYELHYSVVFSASEGDIVRIKDQILEHLKGYLAKIQTSPEENLYSFCIDLFDLNFNKANAPKKKTNP